MSFPVDDFGMNIRAEVKAYNFGFSTAKNLASVIRANDKVTVVTFALPTHACFRPNGLGICPQNVTIIANSQYADQALKLKVRDSVLQKAEEILDGCPDRETAEARLSAALPEIEGAARQRIAAEGADEAVTAELRPTVFPTKEYEDFTLPAGEYLALRVVIGEGEGHNWWCVVFPPLCAETTSDLAETAMAAGLTEDQVALITESDGYVLRFKAVELWERLKAYFNAY